MGGSLDESRDFRMPVRWMTSSTEMEDVARFRYSLFTQEREGETHPLEDRAHRRIVEPADADENARVACVEQDGELLGMLRVRTAPAGRVPEAWVERYGIRFLPRATQMSIAELSSVLIRRGAHEGDTLDALTTVAVASAIERAQVDLILASCRPGELRAYQRLGFRTYGAPIVSTFGGAVIPLVALVADLAYLRECGSPWFTTLYVMESKGQLPKTDLYGFRAALGGGRGVEDGPLGVLSAIRSREQIGATDVLARLPSSVVRRLAGSEFVLDVPAGAHLITPGAHEQEAYVVLSGLLEVTRGARFLTTHLPGEMVGQLAFFRKEGVRTATVRAVTASRVLVLHRAFVDDLIREDPRGACALMEAMAVLLAERLSQV